MQERTTVEGARLRQLVEAGIALSSELSLEGILSRLVETAACVTGARYAALGVLDPAGKTLERFVTHGIDEAKRAEIGAPPRGRGILGVLIADGKPFRLSDLTEDPRAVGFPPGHPPMHSFLGVPVMLRRVTYGNLYLTEKAGDEAFTEEDEEIVQLLAAQAAVAIENSRLYQSATHWLRRLERVNTTANAMATELDLERLLELVVASLADLVDARVVTLWLPGPDGRLQLRASAGDVPPAVAAISPGPETKLGRVFARGRSERSDALLDDPDVDLVVARTVDAAAALWLPLAVQGRTIGVAVCFDRNGQDPRFTDADLRAAEAFVDRVAVAIDLRRRVTRESVRAMLEAQEVERTRIARELHDETGQALTSILLALKPLEREIGVEALGPVRQLIAGALADVRRLAVQLRPAVLDDFGLAPALDRLAETLREESGVAVEVEVALDASERLPGEIETALYRIAQEALTNVARHAAADGAWVRLARAEGSILLTVRDDGTGIPEGADAGRLGLVGIRERVTLLGGSVEIASSPQRGTSVEVELPVTRGV